MKIVIPGGNGHIGQFLAHAFHDDGHEVVVLTRSEQETMPWRTVLWNGETIGDWAKEIDGADVVINLAGRSVNCRYNAQNRKQIFDSRLRSTQAIGKAIAQSDKPPALWLQMSTATIYAHRFDAPNDEETGIIGGNEKNVPETWNFSIEVATSWEATLQAAQTPQTRKVLLRSAIVMAPGRGGPFDALLSLTRFGLGGKAGSGKQFVSWVHYHDFVRALYWIIEHEELSGPVNIAAPNPLPNAAFMKALQQAAGAKIGLPATTWMIELGTRLMQTESELVLKSRRVVPTRLLRSGFEFEYQTWPVAVCDLVQHTS